MADSPNKLDAFEESGAPTNSEPTASAEAAAPTEATDGAAAASRTGKKRGWSLKVGTKIMAVVGFCLLMLITVAGISIWQMNNIGAEIEGIAERDILLTTIVTTITIHQLEQAINFERAMRYGEEMQESADSRKPFEEAVKKFEELTVKVDKEIIEGEELVEKDIKAAATEVERKEFEHVLTALKKIEGEHADFEKHAREVFKLLIAGNVSVAHGLAEKIEVEEEQLDHELEALVEELEKFTLEAARTAEEHEKTAVLQMSIISIVGLLVALALALFIIRRSIARPLSEVVTALEALTAGDFSVEITARSDDEIGAVANALGIFKTAMMDAKRKDEERLEAERQALRDQEKAAEEKKQAEARAAEEKRKAMLELADDFEAGAGAIIETVASAATEMQGSAQSMASTAEETSRQSTAVAAASEQASTNVQTVASAAEELSQSVEEVGRQVGQSNKIAQNAVEEAEKTNDKVQGLAEASQKIGDVVNLINDIASQTNLLALNATIEAARAGDAGKGFAVVASEVKSLAGQTAKATEEIAAQIGAIQSATTEAVDAIQGIGTTIGEISEIATTITSAVDQQSSATKEIAAGVQQAASGTQEVSQNIAGVTQAAGETGEAATQVLDAAVKQAKEAEELRRRVDKFLEQVRAA